MLFRALQPRTLNPAGTGNPEPLNPSLCFGVLVAKIVGIFMWVIMQMSYRGSVNSQAKQRFYLA
jgi:hypothetical protein